MTVLVASALIRPALEPVVPDWLDVRWAADNAELLELAGEAEIGWFDSLSKTAMAETVRRAAGLKWLNSLYAGVDGLPFGLMAERGTILTNGSGLSATTIAEYVVMGMLTMAKGYREVVRAQDRHEWLEDAPGRGQLAGTRALVLGFGPIGQKVQRMLGGFEVAVSVVRRTPGEGFLTPDEWRARLGEFDWIVIAVPATGETDGMIGAAELAAMKPGARIINIARGAVIDQEALLASLSERRLRGAFLDVTTPEPLPPEHPLWDEPNAHITMHLSGRSQKTVMRDAAVRFLDNLERYRRGDELAHRVDYTRGY